MEVVITQSAYKHGISEQSILSCVANARSDIILDELSLKRLFVGFDYIGRALEIIAIDKREQGYIIVIHAMRLRKQFYCLLEEERGIHEL